MERVKARRSNEVEETAASYEEEESDGMAAGLNNLTIETAGTEELAAEQLETVMEMEIAEVGKR